MSASFLFIFPRSEVNETSCYAKYALDDLREEERFLLDRAILSDSREKNKIWSPDHYKGPSAIRALFEYFAHMRISDTLNWEDGDPGVEEADEFFEHLPECAPELMACLEKAYTEFVLEEKEKYDYILRNGYYNFWDDSFVWEKLDSYLDWLKKEVTEKNGCSAEEIEMVQKLSVQRFKEICKETK